MFVFPTPVFQIISRDALLRGKESECFCHKQQHFKTSATMIQWEERPNCDWFGYESSEFKNIVWYLRKCWSNFPPLFPPEVAGRMVTNDEATVHDIVNTSMNRKQNYLLKRNNYALSWRRERVLPKQLRNLCTRLSLYFNFRGRRRTIRFSV